jgi:Protein of unknown function (DUF5131)
VFIWLTKRATRQREYLTAASRVNQINGAIWSLLGTPRGSKIEHGGKWRCTLPMPNCWHGVSAEDQGNADERVPELLATPAAIRFVSAEPLLGPLEGLDLTGIDWLIAGGESGFRHRRMREEWVLELRDRCIADGVTFFFKQWGGRTSKAGGRVLQGRNLGRDSRRSSSAKVEPGTTPRLGASVAAATETGLLDQALPAPGCERGRSSGP